MPGFAAVIVDIGLAPRNAVTVQERYKSFGQYRASLQRGIDDLVKNRFLLCEDVSDIQQRLIQDGLDAGVPAPKGNEPIDIIAPHCRL